MTLVSILVVDDDAVVRHLLRRTVALVQPTAQVHEAATVAQAQSVLQATVPAIVITDYHLPDGTGLDVLAAARTENESCPVYIVSGDAFISGPVAEAGATAFLAKPVDINSLIRALRVTLHRQESS